MKMNKMRSQMIEAFIHSLQEDEIPWEAGWNQERPYNAVTGVKYRGGNWVWLSFEAEEFQYKDPRWCTFKQAQKEGWKIKKGSKGVPLEFWSLYDTVAKKKISYEQAEKLRQKLQLSDQEFSERIKPVASVFVVFNAEQIEGIPELQIEHVELDEKELMQQRDVLLKNMSLSLNEGGDRAFYRPSEDTIFLPEVNLFQDEYSYISTFLHEAAHASGHESRLNRNIKNVFGTPDYAKEELRAEISSAFVTMELGIDGGNMEHVENHKAYIQSWIKILKDDPNELFRAIKSAEKIADYLIEKGEFELEPRNKEYLTEEQSIVTGQTEKQLEGEKFNNLATYTKQEAASLRMALKGRQQNIEMWANTTGYVFGKEVQKYLDQGMDIRDILTNKTPEICKTLNTSSDFFKYEVANIFATTSEEYQEFKNIMDISQKDSMVRVSDGMADKLLNEGEAVYAFTDRGFYKVMDREGLGRMGNGIYYVDGKCFELKRQDVPRVTCRLSEHPLFEEGQVYLVSEFDDMVRQADEDWRQKQKDYLKKYGDVDEILMSDDTEAQRYVGYAKVVFQVVAANWQFEERQDIGDGFDGMLDFLKETSCRHSVPALERIADEERQAMTGRLDNEVRPARERKRKLR